MFPLWFRPSCSFFYIHKIRSLPTILGNLHKTVTSQTDVQFIVAGKKPFCTPIIPSNSYILMWTLCRKAVTCLYLEQEPCYWHEPIVSGSNFGVDRRHQMSPKYTTLLWKINTWTLHIRWRTETCRELLLLLLWWRDSSWTQWILKFNQRVHNVFYCDCFDYIVIISIILWLFNLGTSCTGFVLICTVVVLYCFVMCVCMCVRVGFVMRGCFGNMYTVLWLWFFLPWLRFFRAFSSVVRQMPG
jgi:hypothetical protein